MFAVVSLLFVGVLSGLNRPQLAISWTTNQFRYLEMPDEQGRALRLYNRHDRRCQEILKDHDYDVVWVR